jgi:hypothetical protein
MDTNQVTADATVALAVVGAGALIANAVVALFTLKAARATRRSAEATEKAAQATHDEAEATKQEAAASLQVVEEMKADRELQWSPFLARLTTGNLRFSIANLGGGPAVQAVFVMVDGTDWFKSDTFNLSPNERWDLTVVKQVGAAPPSGPIFASLTGQQHGEALICIDRFGTYHRFLPHVQLQPDSWRSGQPNRPAWVDWVNTHL